MNIDEEIADLLHHDLSINLDASTYKGKLTAYECTLLYMISLGREFVNENNLDFKLLILDYDDKIVVNKKFEIVNYSADFLEIKREANFVLEFIEDVAHDKKYYGIQNKEDTEKVDFEDITTDMSILSFSYKDFKKIIDKFVTKEKLQEEDLVFDIIIHKVDFQLGTWFIDKPYFST